MKIYVEVKHLTAALKAVREFTSPDPTRAALQNILVEAFNGHINLTATDGHTMCSVTVKSETISGGSGTARLTDHAVSSLLLELKEKAKTFAVTEVEIPDTSDLPFPDYRQVLPAVEEKTKTTNQWSFNAEYLARIAHVQKALKAPRAAIQLGKDDTCPLRADIKSELADAIVIVMPSPQSNQRRESGRSATALCSVRWCIVGVTRNESQTHARALDS